MSESKFKVGDRVAAYWDGQRMEATIHTIVDGTIFFAPAGINSEAMRARRFHPKQLRRLVKKPRRRVWIHTNKVGDDYRIASDDITFKESHTGGFPEWTEFIEVKKK